MYIDIENINALEEAYGPTRKLTIDPIRMLDWEYRLLVGSGKNGRRHDVTMFIKKTGDSGRYVCIQKPFYKDSGIYRAPSGGVNPGEAVEAGLLREMKEETGLDVAVDCFPLIIDVEFVSPDGKETFPWKSYVFRGHDVSGEMRTQDPKEIAKIKLKSRDELLGPISDLMLGSGWGGFLYRVKLTRELFSSI